MCEPMDQQDKNNDNPNQVYNSGFPSRTRNQLQVILVTLFGNVDKRHNFYAILDNGSTISYVLNTATDKVRAPKTSEFDLNISHAFDESVMPENFVRLDVGKFNSDQSLFRLNYVHEFWSDSEAIFAWIKSEDKLKTFTANRVKEIRNNTDVSKWQNISGKLNPADHVFRGIPACDLNVFWLTPPAFLSDPENHWKNFLSNNEETNVTMETSNDEFLIDIIRFSKWTKLMRSMAFVIRFIKSLRSKQRCKLELDDTNEARIFLFRKSQEKSFNDAIKDIKQNRSLSKKDCLLRLSPFCESGLPRVCGRTKRSSLPFDFKQPIIMDSKEHSIQLYIQKCHKICMRIRVEYTRNYIQQRCHILRIRAFLGSLASKCFGCLRFRSQGLQPPMADLADIPFQETQSPVIFTNSVEWKLNPPSAPHFGGEWERLVQCAKRALLLNLGSAKRTQDVFATIVSEAECLVNSRAFTHVGSNHEDDNPLTSNHFLLGRPFCNVPGAVFNETLTSKNSAWTQLKQRLQRIWKRLLTEYVPSLNKRQRWTSREAALEVKDVVCLLEELTPRGIWPRVTRTFTGANNIA
ncbi:uncharacterized protein LOC142350477 [Convolutriloba macropyga]|uniref:uncharacterized protein LOC142350477 n=1 Tax=Convolutriloba macropyga TaxID=536237 RepID=UPI003F5223C9